jgi:hypothetical protein
MLETIQINRVMRQHNRTLPLRCVVLACYVLDVLGTMSECGTVYLYTVTHWGDEAYAMKQPWSLSVGLACTGAVSFMVQSYLILRYHSLSKSVLISTALFLLSLLSAGSTFTLSALITIANSYSQRNVLTLPTTIWLSGTAAADCAIAGGLVWELFKMKVRVKTRETDNLIRRLISNAIQTGCATSFVALLILAMYLRDPESNISIAFGFCLGRLYSLTMLLNINSRGGLASGESSVANSTGLSDEISRPQDYHTSIARPRRAHDANGGGVMTTVVSFTRLSDSVDFYSHYPVETEVSTTTNVITM